MASCDGESIIKSPLDTNDYSYIELKNGLRALLISTCPHEDALTKGKVNPKTGVSLKVEEFNRKFVHIPDDEDDESCEAEDDSDECWEPSLKRSKLTNEYQKDKKPRSAWVALCVGVGSLSDPENFKGMAHLCEHMVCLYGSKKYPCPDALDSFVSSHRGYTNALTYQSCTLYFYNLLLDPDKSGLGVFEQSLDMLVDMITNPYFPPEKLKAEVSTIDSEFTISETQDGFRLGQMFSSFFPKGHPLCEFGCGSRNTLDKPKLFQNLCKWKSRHYAANYMTLVIRADLPLEDLETLARKYFSIIPESKKISPAEELRKIRGNPFDCPKFKRFYEVVPYQDMNLVWITWAIEDRRFAQDFWTKPALYLSHLLEGINPLSEFLKKQNWVNSMDTYYCSESGWDLFSSPFTLSIGLTNLGVTEIFKVLQAVLSYLKMLGSQKPSEDLFNEIRRERAEFFHYNKLRAYETNDLSMNLQRMEEPKYILTSRALVTEFDPEFIQKYIRGLTPFNMNVMLISKLHEDLCEDEEKYYHIKYREYDFDKKYLKSCGKAMAFKFDRDFRNPFRTKNIICPVQNLFGINHLRNDQKAKIMHIKSSVCSVGKQPFAMYNFRISSPSIPRNDRSEVFLSICSSLLFDHLEKQVYQCTRAGIDAHHILTSKHGITVAFFGNYTPKMPELIQSFFSAFMDLDNIATEEKFSTFLELYSQSLNNNNMNPIHHIFDTLDNVLIQSYEGLPTTKPLTNGYGLRDFKNFIRVFRDEMRIYGHLMYCVPDEQAKAIAEIIGALNYREYPLTNNHPSHYSPRTMMLPLGDRCVRIQAKSLEVHSNAVCNYYQIGNTYDHIVLDVIDSLVLRAAGYQLRWNERLSYIAGGSVMGWNNEVIGVGIFVVPQATYHSAGYVDERIDAFLIEFRETIEDYNVVVDSRDFPASPRNMRNLYTEEKHQELLDIYDNYLLPSANMRKISIQLTGNPSGGNPVEAQQIKEKIGRLDDHRIGYFINNIPASKNAMCVYSVPERRH